MKLLEICSALMQRSRVDGSRKASQVMVEWVRSLGVFEPDLKNLIAFGSASAKIFRILS
jgi:hypothetical protein